LPVEVRRIPRYNQTHMKQPLQNYCFSNFLKISILIVFLLLGFTVCRKPEKTSSAFRLLDMTTTANVIETPFRNLGKHFKSFRGTFSKAPVDLTSIFGGDSQRVWGYSTPTPLLDIDASRKPRYCRLYKAGEILPYFDDNPAAAESWRWIKGEETAVFDRDIKFSDLDPKEPIVEHACLLPESRFILLIKARNHRHTDTAPRLQVLLDEMKIGEITLRKARDYRVEGYANAGRHTIRVIHAPETSESISENIHFSIKHIEIKCFSDLLLLYRMKEVKTIPETGSYAVSYVEEPFLSDYEENPEPRAKKDALKQRLFQLHRFNQNPRFFPGSRTSGKNPFNLKKKLALENNSCNILFTPTPTLLAYDLEVPEKGCLEFGYGLMRSLPGSARFPTEFTIRLQDEGTAKDIFSARIKPSDRVKYRLDETIDLEAYAGHKVRLEFRTRIDSKKPISSKFISDAYWFNPVLYPDRAPADDAPNIILVSLDTLRPGHLKSFGYSRETSPHLDALMRDGVTFRKAISTAPSTLRAHMSLFTGLNSNRHQVYTSDNRLHDKIPTLTEFLRARGYATCALTGGGRVSAKFGFDRGFDRYLESTGTLHIRDKPEALWGMARKWLESNQNKRFFLFLHTYQIHGPYQNDHPLGKAFLSPDADWKSIDLRSHLNHIDSPIPSKYIPLSDKQKQNINALYDGEIRYTDDALIKPLVSTLKDMGLYDNTLLIIFSDHGEEFYEHKMWLHGLQLYDELIHVLCVMKFPHSRHRGDTVDRNIRITDIMPTILEQSGIKSKDIDIDGWDLMPLIRGKRDPQRTAYADIPGRIRPGRVAVVEDNYKLILNREGTGVSINPYNPPELELYDLETDPLELNNLADSDYATVKFLLEKIEKYIEVEKASRGLGGEKTDLDPELLERLKALGYIN